MSISSEQINEYIAELESKNLVCQFTNALSLNNYSDDVYKPFITLKGIKFYEYLFLK
jgi:hypothetical protein